MALIGKTAQVYYGAAAGDTDPTNNILYVDSIGDITLTADEIDDTVYGSSTWKTYIAGLKDGSAVPIVVNYDSTATSHKFLVSRFMDGVSHMYKIRFPRAATTDAYSYQNFTGIVTGMTLQSPKDEKIQRTFNIRYDAQTDPSFNETA